MDEPFANPTNLGPPVNATGDNAEQPHTTADGRSLYYRSRRFGTAFEELYVASRTDPADPFSTPTRIDLGLDRSVDPGGPFLSRDGRTLYFYAGGSDAELDLFRSTRSGPGEPFGDVQNLGPVNSSVADVGPAVSSDELAIFFTSRHPDGESGSTNIWVATRESTSDPFTNAVLIDDFSQGSDLTDPLFIFSPHISPDWPAFGSKIVYSATLGGSDWDIYEATWVPEPSAPVLAAMVLASLVARRSGVI